MAVTYTGAVVDDTTIHICARLVDPRDGPDNALGVADDVAKARQPTQHAIHASKGGTPADAAMDERGQVLHPGQHGVAVISMKGLKALQVDRMLRAAVTGARWSSWKDFRFNCITGAAVYTASIACTGVLTLRASHGG